ncbi:MAG: outer membrane beta-barrel protein [Acidobacteriota bacterium]
MSRFVGLVGAVVAVLLVASPVQAETPEGAWEIEAFAGWSTGRYDDSSIVGLRLGKSFAPGWVIKGAFGTFDDAEGKYGHDQITLDVSFERHFAARQRHQFILSMGPGFATSKLTMGGRNLSNDTLTAHLGIGGKIKLGGAVHLRPDLRFRWYEDQDDRDAELTLAINWTF